DSCRRQRSSIQGTYLSADRECGNKNANCCRQQQISIKVEASAAKYSPYGVAKRTCAQLYMNFRIVTCNQSYFAGLRNIARMTHAQAILTFIEVAAGFTGPMRC